MDHSRERFQAPRCGARTPSGIPCQRRAIRGRKRCRLHGGLSPGAPRGEENGNFKTGNWTIEAIEERQWFSLQDRNGVAFILNVTDPAAAHDMLEKLPLGQAHLMSFELIPLAPLDPLRQLQGMTTGLP